MQGINNYDMRRLQRSRILWASVICTESSPAGGNKAPANPGQLDLLKQCPIQAEAWVRTRACAYDVIRAAEVWAYDVIVVENVVEFITRWPLFNWWATAWELLGYHLQIASLSSAHIGDQDQNPRAPQWRDRIYIVLTRHGIPVPDLAPRPPAWCQPCGQEVEAVQTWRDTPLLRQLRYRIGKYRKQYDYRCPNTACRHALVEPYVAAAASIIDWSDLGPRIGDRADLGLPVLVANTRARIRAGILKHHSHPVEPIQHCDGRLAIPQSAFVDMARRHATGVPLDSPVQALSSARHHSLVVPYREATVETVAEPMLTLGTKDSVALVSTDLAGPVSEDDIDRCLYRMFTARESLRGQRFHDSYVVIGNPGEQQIQAGNAVSVNVAQWLGGRIADALDGIAA